MINIRSTTSTEGAVAGAGNILAGGLIGIAVDAGSGANLDHFPNPVHVDFTKPAEQAQQIAEAHAAEVKRQEALKRAQEKAAEENAEGPGFNGL